jgi:hypothetical protein
MIGRGGQRRSRPTSRKRLKGMKMAVERRPEVTSRKFWPVRMENISEDIHSLRSESLTEW